jgi:hypothetical protein
LTDWRYFSGCARSWISRRLLKMCARTVSFNRPSCGAWRTASCVSDSAPVVTGLRFNLGFEMCPMLVTEHPRQFDDCAQVAENERRTAAPTRTGDLHRDEDQSRRFEGIGGQAPWHPPKRRHTPPQSYRRCSAISFGALPLTKVPDGPVPLSARETMEERCASRRSGMRRRSQIDGQLLAALEGIAQDNTPSCRRSV